MSIKKVSCSNFFYFGLTIDSSSLYSVYLAHKSYEQDLGKDGAASHIFANEVVARDIVGSS